MSLVISALEGCIASEGHWFVSLGKAHAQAYDHLLSTLQSTEICTGGETARNSTMPEGQAF